MPARFSLLLLLLAAIGCQRQPGTDAAAPDAAGAREAMSGPAELRIDLEGKPLALPLENFDVYLTEEDEYPETFELHGPGVMLVGTFPKDVRVDYGEHWQVLVGKPIEILPAGDNEDAVSSVTPPDGTRLQVLGGTLTVEKIGEDAEGNTRLSGRIELKLEAPDGEKAASGTFSAPASTWG